MSLWLKQQRHLTVNHEWVYQHILQDKRDGGTLYRHLSCQKQRKKRYGAYERRGQIPNKISIEQRPAIVEQRTRLGDWELDTIIGKGHKQAIVFLSERKSRLSLIAKVATNPLDFSTDNLAGMLTT
ncbi:MAG: IS30 family transposase [Candidatus Thiodiazotropha endolucinida]